MGNPKVSVVIPAYNHEKFVGEAIQSVLDQTFQDFELIIINDGSTDNTEAEILQFKDDRIRYYSQENRGLSATLNRGIELARGEYFNFLPSDDAFLPEKLEVQLKAFEESEEIGVVFSYQTIIDGEGNEITDDPVVEWFQVPFETKEEIFPALFERDFLSVPTALIRMKCFNRAGLFDESLKTAQDYDMWMRILKYYDLRLIKKHLLKMRWHGANLTYQATPETEMERAKLLLKAYKNLDIEDIFPSLQEQEDPLAYSRAYEILANSIEKGGLPGLLPLARIYRDKGEHLMKKKSDFVYFTKEGREKEEGFPSRRVKRRDGRIHILVEAISLDKGGLEEVVYSIVTHLDRDLYDPVVVCTEKGGMIEDRIRRSGIPVEILGSEKEREYLEILRRFQIDLVNTHYSLFGSALAHREGIPVVSVLHSLYGWLSNNILDPFRMADQYVSRYIAVSRQVASFFTYRFNIDPGRISIIPGGIDVERLTAREGTEELSRHHLGMDEGDFIFLHVGAISPAKMHNLLIAAMREISKIHPEIKLVSIGQELDQDYHHFLQKKIAEYELGQSVQMIGFREDPSPYYRLADAFVLPSLIEGFGIVSLEAMYHGLPLILTKVGGADELVQDGDIGILIENCCDNPFRLDGSDLDYYSHLEAPKNTLALTEAMIDLYTHQREWKKKASKGKEKVLSHYTWGHIIRQYEREFISLALEREREKERKVASRLGKIVISQRKRIDEQSKRMRDLEGRLDEETKEIGIRVNEMENRIVSLTTGMESNITSLTAEFQRRTDVIHQRLDYILERLSFTARGKERLFKTFKFLHTLVPRSLREKYRFRYRKVFFNRAFPEKEKLETPAPTLPGRANDLAEEEIGNFLASAQKNDSQWLVVIYAADPYVESRGQRSTWLAREFSHRGIPVVLFYWRWDPKEEIVRSLNPLIFSVPIDLFGRLEKYLLSFPSNQFRKVFLIEFPDSFLFEKINTMNIHTFTTVYDCIDDWEQFARAGQAVWYDPAVEKYLVHNVNLTMATHPTLAEKLRGMGAETVPVIPNGVDTESLNVKQRKSIDLQRGTLTIGYFGYLTESWFDWDLVTGTASKRKDWVFHVIGYGEPSGLKLPENVRFWGKVEHQDLPSYTRFWDVAIIPFREGRLTDAVDPIKLYEYLYLGLPVVATNMPHLQGKPGVFPCTSSDFEKTLLLAKQSTFPKKEADTFVQNNTWQQRVDRILKELERIDPSRDILKNIG